MLLLSSTHSEVAGLGRNSKYKYNTWNRNKELGFDVCISFSPFWNCREAVKGVQTYIFSTQTQFIHHYTIRLLWKDLLKVRCFRGLAGIGQLCSKMGKYTAIFWAWERGSCLLRPISAVLPCLSLFWTVNSFLHSCAQNHREGGLPLSAPHQPLQPQHCRTSVAMLYQHRMPSGPGRHLLPVKTQQGKRQLALESTFSISPKVSDLERTFGQALMILSSNTFSPFFNLQHPGKELFLFSSFHIYLNNLQLGFHLSEIWTVHEHKQIHSYNFCEVHKYYLHFRNRGGEGGGRLQSNMIISIQTMH